MSPHHRFAGTLKVLALLFCVLAIGSRAWVAEDGYITFRVVENFFSGFGLVFNPGERVEAFTHPLWMLCLILLKTMGLDLHLGSILLGLMLSLSAATLLIYANSNREALLGAMLVAPALCAVSGFRDFATAGMEFSLVFFLLVILDQLMGRRSVHERPAAAATVLALLYLTRPEMALAAIYYSVPVAYQILRPDSATSVRQRLILALRWALPFISVAGSWHLFRAIYYQDIFPNTYYAKSGAATYFSQGIKYLFHTIAYAPALWPLLLGVGAFLGLHTLRHQVRPRSLNTSVRELGLAALLALYWVRAGGDFMSFRFLLPSIVLLALVARRLISDANVETSSLQSIRQSVPISAGMLLLFVGLSFVPAPFARGFIADERQVFVKEAKVGLAKLIIDSSDQPWAKRGRAFGQLQQCLRLEELRISNSQAGARCLKGVGLGYFGVAAGPGVLILDEQGLPNKNVASQPVMERFRPGHEHFVTLQDVIDFGAAFCSTGEAAYDRAMLTPAGIVISLNPNLLLGMPRIVERLEQLQRQKSQGSLVIPRLEKRYQTTIEDLLTMARAHRNDEFLRARQECWQKFPGGPDTFVY